MITNLSNTEIEFIRDGITQNVRIDGRERFDYRPFTLEVGTITQANGSARLSLGETKILVGVKAEIGEPLDNAPNEGVLKVAVECCPTASPYFEGRGAEELNIKLSNLMEKMLLSSAHIDLGILCLIPKKQCWILYIEILVLDCGGNLVDAISIATRAALANTTVPLVKVVEAKKPGEYEFELDGDIDNNIIIPVENVPIFVSFNQIGSYLIVDPSLQEELCLGCRISIGINKIGNICTIDKGNGMIGLETLPQIMSTAKTLGLKILNLIDGYKLKSFQQQTTCFDTIIEDDSLVI
ncbi:putative exosome complex exonuclease RRP42 [Schistocerca gregaria]|uniref:putative exosome complex exonuclease RRP42 n=1 Tax=Schistocerca gregaria TaxID=7010 RepID=UPI00211F02CB|nr:putative exosome complex exonuclease RRP42 [Schistocerca gregaria]